MHFMSKRAFLLVHLAVVAAVCGKSVVADLFVGQIEVVYVLTLNCVS